MFNSFVTHSFGKWILAGEHAVLRGVPALVFPIKSKFIKLSYCNEGVGKGLICNLSGSSGQELEILFWGVLEKAIEIKNIDRHSLNGRIELDSCLPVGAGMGASAALCVAVSRWLEHLRFVKTDEIYEFSRQLENLFHGESSGVDIAVSMGGEPLYFERSGNRKPFLLSWNPQWYLSYSGQRGITMDCVKKVKSLFEFDTQRAQYLDEEMKKSVSLCMSSLCSNHEGSLSELIEGIEKAQSCFESWGLCEGSVANHVSFLKKVGAKAVKLTGSGGGGYVLSLWTSKPPQNLEFELIPC